METMPKSPQEMAAQLMDAHPYFGDHLMPEGHAAEMAEKAKALKEEIEGMNLYMLPDDELMAKLADVKARAIESGVWEPIKGEQSDERIAFAVDQMKSFGYTEEEAVVGAVKDLRGSGYLEAIKDRRKEQELLFQGPTNEYLNDRDLDDETEKWEIDQLLERTIDLTTLTPTELTKLAQNFPSGNFVYHGAGTEQLVKIIDSGALVNAKALYEREDAAAKAEGREASIVRRNSGFEGVSWSMNGIDALPGDRYHLAGFVGAPEVVLSDTQQFAVPSRPAPNEVLQISNAVEANKFYDAKTQLELYRNSGVFGESNSVFDNLSSISMWEKAENSLFQDEPMLHQAKRGMLAQPGYQKQLRDLYDTQPDGVIRLNPDLLQQADNDIPVAAVWLQAAIDTERLKDTLFAGKEVPEIIDSLNGDNTDVLFAAMRKDWQQFKDILDAADNAAEDIEVPVEAMYFVAPRKDAEIWLKIFARSQHKPAGILLYDDKKVRLENFASSHRGDHAELTSELQSAISPDNEKYINYANVLGSEFSDDMRAGRRRQVIAERYLSDRRVIVKDANNKLVVRE